VVLGARMIGCLSCCDLAPMYVATTCSFQWCKHARPSSASAPHIRQVNKANLRLSLDSQCSLQSSPMTSSVNHSHSWMVQSNTVCTVLCVTEQVKWPVGPCLARSHRVAPSSSGTVLRPLILTNQPVTVRCLVGAFSSSNLLRWPNTCWDEKKKS